MNEKIKKILIAIGAFFIGIVGFIFGRHIDRRRSGGDDAISQRIRTGIDEQQGINKQHERDNTKLGENNRKLESINNAIERNNTDAITGIRKAKSILEQAKNRQSKSQKTK